MEPQYACRVIMACRVLHNIARRARLEYPNYEAEVEGNEEIVAPHNRQGLQAREDLIQNYFY